MKAAALFKSREGERPARLPSGFHNHLADKKVAFDLDGGGRDDFGVDPDLNHGRHRRDLVLAD
jgi:hypothetical protein